jgi:HK97 family phage prohead protease
MQSHTQNRFIFRNDLTRPNSRAQPVRFEVGPPAAAARGAAIATLRGYPLVWGATSTDRGGYRVRIAQNSAQFVRKVHALFEHSFDGGPLGDTDSFSLRVQPADAIGIGVEIDLPDTQCGRDVFFLVKNKRVTGMSFSMVEAPWTWINGVLVPDAGGSRIYSEGGETIVEALRFLVDEVTITARPAFETTSIGVQGTSTSAGFSERTRQSNQIELNKLAMINLGIGIVPQKIGHR